LDESAGILATEALGLAQLAEASVLTGRVDDGRRYAERALDASRARQERSVEAWALRALGDIAACGRGVAARSEAAAHYAAALRIASGLGLRPFAAHCHMRLAWLRRKDGMSTELEAAIHAFREMGMTYDLARATRGLPEFC
jgi:hypothetical protein